jgi:predicted MFS family arabinose efflux permease
MASVITESKADITVVGAEPTRKARRFFPWLVFALTFALLLSDYMARQVLSAVFPLLKAEWALSDTKLGALTSVVALTVGLLAMPLSLLGDRWGRSRSIILMASI